MNIERDAHHASIEWITQENEQMDAKDIYESGYIQGRRDAPKEQVQITKPLTAAQVHALAAEIWDETHGTKWDELSPDDQDARAYGLHRTLTRAGILAVEP